MNRCLRVFLCVCAMSVMGCHAASPSTGSSFSKSSSRVVTHKAPEVLCAPRDVPTVSRPARTSTGEEYIYADELLLSGIMDTVGTVELESGGARLADVIAELAESAGLAVSVRGQGAYVPIFATYDSEDKDAVTFLRELAASAGMLVVEDDGMLHVLDPHDAAELQRSINQRAMKLSPPVTIALPDQRARMLAPALAETLLGCQERIMLVHDTNTMLLHMRDTQHTQIKTLIAKIDVLKQGEHVTMPVSSSRRELWGVAEPRMKPCPVQLQFTSMDLDGMSTLGMRMFELAEAGDEINSVLIGCGGLDYINGWIGESGSLNLWLRASELRTVGTNVFTTREIATAYAIDGGGLRAPSTTHVLSALRAKKASMLVAVLREHYPELSPSLATDEVLLMRGEHAKVDAARQFVLNLNEMK